MAERRGLVMVITGDGKGKTTSALGMALRAIGHEQRVLLVQFMKGQSTGEMSAITRFLPQIDYWQGGREGFVNPDNPDDIDLQLARETMEQVLEAVVAGIYDLVILDELNVAVDYGLVSEALVLKLLSVRPANVSLILTGRGASQGIQDAADLVSEVREVKHHWRQGVPAQPGIEF